MEKRTEKQTTSNSSNNKKVTIVNHDFKDVNRNGIFTFHDVCIELDPNGKQMSLNPNQRVHAKKLVVYNAAKNGKHILRTVASHSSWYRDWEVLFVKQHIPNSHTYITDYPVYFTSPVSFGNFFHFWKDFHIGLYGAMKVSRRLGIPNGNQLYVREYNDIVTSRPW